MIVPLFAGAALHGQFTSGVNLVEVYATVTDPQGHPVTGLTAADFQVSEDGMPQAVTTFAAGEFPLAAAVAIDRSFSMGDRLAAAQAAARSFITALRPEDQVMVVAIGSGTEVMAPLGPDHQAALAAVDRIDRWGTTPLYDATLTAIEAIQPAAGRRALILLSDGTDRYSAASASDVLDDARHHDVLVYPVAIGKARPPLFAELAAATGGRSFHEQTPRGLQTAMQDVARELRFQYLLGYAPAHAATTAPGAPRWRSIEVHVARRDAIVRARDGYWAP